MFEGLTFNADRMKMYSDRTIQEWFDWWVDFRQNNPLTCRVCVPNDHPPFTFDELQGELKRRKECRKES